MKDVDSLRSPAKPAPTLEPPNFFELINEVLLSAIPYRRKPVKTDDLGFYLVCDYSPVPRGTVLLYYPPGAEAVQVHGYLPQGTAAEQAALRELLQEHTQAAKLNFSGMLKHNLRVCTEREGVQRLLEIHRLLGVARASTHRQIFH